MTRGETTAQGRPRASGDEPHRAHPSSETHARRRSPGALIVVFATRAYTGFGGLRAVFYMDLIQTFVLLGGAMALTFAGLSAVGDWGTMAKIVGPDVLDK